MEEFLSLQIHKMLNPGGDARRDHYRTCLTNYVAKLHDLTKATGNAYWLNEPDLNNIDLIHQLLSAGVSRSDRFMVSRDAIASITQRIAGRRNEVPLNLDHAVPIAVFKEQAMAKDMTSDRLRAFVDCHYSYALVTERQHDQNPNRFKWQLKEHLFARWPQSAFFCEKNEIDDVLRQLREAQVAQRLEGKGHRSLAKRFARSSQVGIEIDWRG